MNTKSAVWEDLLGFDLKQEQQSVSAFREAVASRLAALHAPEVIDPAAIDRLAYYSGGRALDFVTMIRKLAGDAYVANAETATAAMVDRVIDEQRRLVETGLHRGHIRVLKAIAADRDHRLPDDPLVPALLANGKLLPFTERGATRYYPHPLLTIRFLRVA